MSIPLKLRPLAEAAGAAINSIKLNGVSAGRHRGRPLRVKRRRRGSEAIAGLANLFFPLANAPVSVWANPIKWQRWEIHCYHLLNGARFRAFAAGPRTVCVEKLPGKNLHELAKAKKLNRRVLRAAAREIRRAHSLRTDRFHGPWSHADLHLGNVIYDPKADRARLIDFEVVHEKPLPAVTRHADDLLAFLQDMMGRVPARKWVPLALCFLDAYDRPRVIAKLRGLLVIPDGIPGMWWAIRTNYLDRTKLRRRVQALRRALDGRAERKIRQSPLRKIARPHRSTPLISG